MSDTFTITGQVPADLDPLDLPTPLTIDSTHPGAEYDMASQLSSVINDTWLQPLNPGTPVSVTHHQGLQSSTLDADDIAAIIAEALSEETTSAINHARARELTAQLSIHANTQHNLPAHQFLVSQAFGRIQLPAPSIGRVFYSVNHDIIPAAKNLMSDRSQSAWDKLHTAISAVFTPRIYGVGVISDREFTAFQQHLRQVVATHAAHIDADTHVKLRRFDQLTLDGLTEAQLLRKDDNDHTDEYSYARVLIYAVRDWLTQQRDQAAAAGLNAYDAQLLGFDLQQVLMPEAIVFVNADAHAHSSARTITTEWTEINDALNMIPPPVSLRQINKLTAPVVAQKKLAAMTVRAGRKDQQDDHRRDVQPLTDHQPSVADIGRDVAKMLTTLGNVQRSQNFSRTRSFTRNKPSRRRPNDVDARGMRTTKKYYPDLHFYIDCSGSMSEENFDAAAEVVAQIAADRGINLYVTSFAHFLSQDVLLPTKNRSAAQIKNMIMALPKVYGGTRYEVIWDHISSSQERSHRMNIIATDFEYRPHYNDKHSPNTFYVPCDMGDWSITKDELEGFTQAMLPIDITIPERILGVY